MVPRGLPVVEGAIPEVMGDGVDAERGLAENRTRPVSLRAVLAPISAAAREGPRVLPGQAGLAGPPWPDSQIARRPDGQTARHRHSTSTYVVHGGHPPHAGVEEPAGPVAPAPARDGGGEHFTRTTGLPLATYFAGPKVRWILDNVEGARDAVSCW